MPYSFLGYCWVRRKFTSPIGPIFLLWFMKLHSGRSWEKIGWWAQRLDSWTPWWRSYENNAIEGNSSANDEDQNRIPLSMVSSCLLKGGVLDGWVCFWAWLSWIRIHRCFGLPKEWVWWISCFEPWRRLLLGNCAVAYRCDSCPIPNVACRTMISLLHLKLTLIQNEKVAKSSGLLFISYIHVYFFFFPASSLLCCPVPLTSPLLSLNF